MQSIVLKAHYDGKNILLDEPYNLEPNTELLVTVMKKEDKEENFYLLSQQGLIGAYSEQEEEYPLTLIKESNPEYERR